MLNPKSPPKDRLRLWAVAVWIVVWQAVSMAVGQRMLLASPADTLVRLAGLVRTPDFWRSVAFSMAHIMSGFLLAVVCAAFLAAASFRYRRIGELFAPLLAAVRSVPVASFVIIALIWLPSRRLSVLISFLIALPVLYAGILTGIRQTDPLLIEMADVFRMSRLRRLLCLRLPALTPSLRSSAGVAVGLAWKSGVAAEVIALSGGSVGEMLYNAKIYFATPDLFAWTLTIVLMSLLCERLVCLLIDLAARALERM